MVRQFAEMKSKSYSPLGDNKVWRCCKSLGILITWANSDIAVFPVTEILLTPNKKIAKSKEASIFGMEDLDISKVTAASLQHEVMICFLIIFSESESEPLVHTALRMRSWIGDIFYELREQ